MTNLQMQKNTVYMCFFFVFQINSTILCGDTHVCLFFLHCTWAQLLISGCDAWPSHFTCSFFIVIKSDTDITPTCFLKIAFFNTDITSTSFLKIFFNKDITPTCFLKTSFSNPDITPTCFLKTSFSNTDITATCFLKTSFYTTDIIATCFLKTSFLILSLQKFTFFIHC